MHAHAHTKLNLSSGILTLWSPWGRTTPQNDHQIHSLRGRRRTGREEEKSGTFGEEMSEKETKLVLMILFRDVWPQRSNTAGILEAYMYEWESSLTVDLAYPARRVDPAKLLE